MAVLIRTMTKGGYYLLGENYLKIELEFAKSLILRQDDYLRRGRSNDLRGEPVSRTWSRRCCNLCRLRMMDEDESRIFEMLSPPIFGFSLAIDKARDKEG